MNDVPAGWLKAKMADVFSERSDRNAGDLELLAVTSGSGIIPQIETGRRDTSPEDKSRYKVVHPNDIAYNSMRLWQGVLGFSDRKGIVSPAYTVLKPINESVDTKFLSYLMKTPEMINTFNRYSSGMCSDTNNCKWPAFKTIPVKIPKDTKEQTKIAEILTSVDDVIELTEKEIEKLQMLKKGMMQDLLTKGIAHTKFKDSPVGRIPESWEMAPLKSFIKVSSGIGLSQRDMQSGKHYVYGGNGVNGSHDEFTHKENQLIVGRVGAYCGNVHITQKYSWITDNALIVKFVKKGDMNFWKFKLNHLDLNSFCFAGAQPVITGGIIYPIKVAIPDVSEQKDIAKILGEISTAIEDQFSKRNIFQNLKKALMSDLLTGKVRVKV